MSTMEPRHNTPQLERILAAYRLTLGAWSHGGARQ